MVGKVDGGVGVGGLVASHHFVGVVGTGVVDDNDLIIVAGSRLVDERIETVVE